MILSMDREKELRSRSRLTQAEACELLYIRPTTASAMFAKNKDFLKGTYYVINKRRIFITEKLVEFMDSGGETGEIKEENENENLV